MVDLADGTYTVHVRADGFTDAEESVTIDGADEELRVQLEEDNGTIDDDEETTDSDNETTDNL